MAARLAVAVLQNVTMDKVIPECALLQLKLKTFP